MGVMFQKTKLFASPNVSIFPNDTIFASFYNRNMATRPHHDWFLSDWLRTLQVRQARLMELAGWDKRKASELVSGKQRYNRDVLNDAAHALNLQPYELLMHPADAMEIRELRRSIQLAAERRTEFKAQPDDFRKQIGE